MKLLALPAVIPLIASLLIYHDGGFGPLEWLLDVTLVSWCTLAGSMTLVMSFANAGCLIVSYAGHESESGENSQLLGLLPFTLLLSGAFALPLVVLLLSG
jgi:hypothetical protein